MKAHFTHNVGSNAPLTEGQQNCLAAAKSVSRALPHFTAGDVFYRLNEAGAVAYYDTVALVGQRLRTLVRRGLLDSRENLATGVITFSFPTVAIATPHAAPGISKAMLMAGRAPRAVRREENAA